MALTTAAVISAGATAAGAYSDHKANKAANKQSQDQYEDKGQFILDQSNKAQNFLTGAFPGIQQATHAGYQGAADLLGGIAPQQINALNQGSMQAQNYILAGLPAYQAAIMGTPQSFQQIASQMPRAQISYDPSIFSQKVFGAPK